MPRRENDSTIDSNNDSNNEEVDPATYFAAERTLLAWIRTAIALMGFGLVVARFGLFLREIAAARGIAPVHRVSFSMWIGTTLIVLGIGVSAIAALYHLRYVRNLVAKRPFRRPAIPWGVVLATLLSLIGLFAAGYLLLEGREETPIPNERTSQRAEETVLCHSLTKH